MGVVSYFRNLGNALINKRNDNWLSPSNDALFGVVSSESSSGISVNADTAMRSTAVFGCVRLISQSIGVLPFNVYRYTDNTGKRREKATDHPLYPLLHNLPNPEITSITFRECLQAHGCLRGNSYAEIVRDRLGRISALWPIPSSRMLDVQRKNGKLYYLIDIGKGKSAALDKSKVFHIQGLSTNGVTGLGPIQLMKEAVGLTLATEKYGAKLFGNSARPSGALRLPGKLTDPARDNLRKSWESAHQGLENSHRVAILEEGLDWVQIGLTAEDSQFLETRKFQIPEVCRMFGVNPHKIYDLEKATYSNIESQEISFVRDAILPWSTRWEQAGYRDLLSPEERREYFFKLLLQGLMRGETDVRYASYKEGFQNGWMTPNEIRELEDMNTIDSEHGDMFFVPMNMVPADQAGNLISAKIANDNNNKETKDPEENKQTEETETRIEEPKREVRSSKPRRKLIKRFKPILQEAATRMMKIEINDVRNKAKKYLGKRGKFDFSQWLEEFYKKHDKTIRKQMKRTIEAYADAVSEAVLFEIAMDTEEGLDVDVNEFTEEYIENFIIRQINSSRGQLKALVRDTEEDELLDVINTRLDEWEKGAGEARPRAERIADRESIQINGAITRLIGVAAGFSLVWRNNSGDSCEYCRNLNGKTVGGQTAFVEPGEYTPKDNVVPMKIRSPRRVPPLHDGCQCSIELELAA